MSCFLWWMTERFEPFHGLLKWTVNGRLCNLDMDLKTCFWKLVQFHSLKLKGKNMWNHQQGGFNTLPSILKCSEWPGGLSSVDVPEPFQSFKPWNFQETSRAGRTKAESARSQVTARAYLELPYSQLFVSASLSPCDGRETAFFPREGDCECECVWKPALQTHKQKRTESGETETGHV